MDTPEAREDRVVWMANIILALLFILIVAGAATLRALARENAEEALKRDIEQQINSNHFEKWR